MLDQFIWGKVSRISPEAPVPIVETLKETYVLGGAANVAANISSLGGKSVLCGVIGKDYFGKKLKQELNKKNIDASLLYSDKDMPTILKTRIIAQTQQIVRLDREKRGEVKISILEKLLKRIENTISQIDIIIFSDYDKGLSTDFFISSLIDISHKNNIPLIVDPKPQNLLKFKKVMMVTPNISEAYLSVGKIPYLDYPLKKLGEEILKLLEVEAVLITQGAEGMTLFIKNKSPVHIPAITQEVYDVTGAGDTVISALTLSYAGGGDILTSVKIANYAASVVVKKIGTATLTPKELLGAILS